jgi:SAM-dependent methyltransferase
LAADDLVSELTVQRRAWDSRPLVRELYHDWFARMSAALAAGPGPTVEIGAGIGTFKEFRPDVVATDVLPTPWADVVADARDLPYEDDSVANVVGIDVLHHVPQPDRCLAEIERVLRPGGRLVLCEPYVSPASWIAYRFLHHEDIDMHVDPFAQVAHSSERALDANGALPTLIFWKHRDRFAALHPRLRIVARERLAMIVYPLSGGFTRQPLLPAGLLPLARRLERALGPLAPLLAFRGLVVVEKR